MTFAAKLRRAPLRIAAGAYILNSGITKLDSDDDASKMIHGMAAGTYPVLHKVQHKQFSRALAIGEVALGGALLTPLIPAGLAGLGLAGFAGGLLGLYWRTPGMHEEGSPRPTQQGTALAKDVWMLGIGTSLVIDAVLTESKVTGDEARAQAKATIKSEAKQARKRAHRAAKSAQRTANRVSKQATDMLPG